MTAYEVDQRRAEIIVEQLGISHSSKSVLTPNVRSSGQDETPLGVEATGMYRAVVARADDSSPDRADVGRRVKEWLGYHQSEWPILDGVRPSQFEVRLPRAVGQSSCVGRQHIDHAGCLRTQSTHGGEIMFGHHTIKQWSRKSLHNCVVIR